MIQHLTSNPLVRFHKKFWGQVRVAVSNFLANGDRRLLLLKVGMAALTLGFGALFFGTLSEYRATTNQIIEEGGTVPYEGEPSIAPVYWQGLGALLALVAFVITLWVKPSDDRTSQGGAVLIIVSLWVAALASLVSWLPVDVIHTQNALAGKALAGEVPSIPAYLGQLLVIATLILSVPIAAMVYFQLGIMDRYIVHSYLSPFVFCLFSFVAIWVIGDITNNGDKFSGLPAERLITFYVVQMPHVVLFVMPIVVLLSGLSSLSKLSKTNEFISMVGSGRSVYRILLPIFIVGAYASLISLAFKYEWAPNSVGYKEAMESTALKEVEARRAGQEVKEDIWAKEGWMHVNEVDRRTWFVGRVPFRLSDEMAELIVIQFDQDGQPEKIWIAERAKWLWNTTPPRWVLTKVRVYEYADKFPTIAYHDQLVTTGWSETPWKVLSSSQEANHLGLPGLTMYLNANQRMEKDQLAAFRTNWWDIFSEPMTCFSMVLVAAPLGIAYSRRGAMGGVTGAIMVFALMYLMRSTLLALGHAGRLNPFVAAWATTFFVAFIGVFLLWFRARNRDVPKLKDLFTWLFQRKKRTTAAS